jgi:peptidylprolyl isomerase/FKBP-type peptidyl-prolyl cis-trans isomerase FklB
VAAAAVIGASSGLAGCGDLYGFPTPPPANPLEALMRQQQPPPADPAAMTAFLEDNKKSPGVRTTASGLQYKVIASGPAAGAHPAPGDAVRVNYKGTLSDGTPFDASQPGRPSEWQVGQLVEGFNEALALMKPGDKWMIYIPPALAYGDQSPPGSPIPPGSVLVFEVELVEVTPSSAPTADG